MRSDIVPKMKKDLVTSNIDRQNVLNNRLAIENIQNQLDFPGMFFENEYRYTKKMVADFYQVDTSTVDRYLTEYSDELKSNGYILSKGKQLKDFKLQFGHLINEVNKTTQLGLFNFRAFLNIGMLLTESEKAKEVRSIILDIVIGTINEKCGGGTKYINRKDTNYIYNFVYGEDRKEDNVVVNDKIKALAKKIKEIIDTKSSFADWLNNQNVRNQLKFDIKICLVKNGYPPQYSPDVYKKVMEQVENYKEHIVENRVAKVYAIDDHSEAILMAAE